MLVLVHTQLCPTLCNPLDSSPSHSSVHWITSARILEWVATSSCRGSFGPRDQAHVSCVSCFGRHILYPCATGEGSHLNTSFHKSFSPIAKIFFLIILKFHRLIKFMLWILDRGKNLWSKYILEIQFEK